jgi:3-oxoadipate enol-lactonase/4-carboxymuconolactone decarboxylase
MSRVPVLTGVQLGAGDPTRQLLVLGPSLGTSATTLWGAAADILARDFHVLAWDLPGHGNGTPATDPFSIADLAAAVLALVDEVLAARGEAHGSFLYAGDSTGGAVGLQLLLDHPGRIRAATLICTGAVIGTPAGWTERAEIARTGRMSEVVASAPGRWFAPGFTDQHPEIAARLIQALQDCDPVSYAAACESLAGFDVRSRLPEILTPVLAVAGLHDQPTPVASLQEIATGVVHGRLVVLDDVAHLAPAEAPGTVTRLIAEHSHAAHTVAQVRAAGTADRRAVLGDAHVDQAGASSSPFTQDFQDLITQYAWGTIWTRPGLDRRSRSLITLTALVARGHHEELALHVRAARTNGLTDDEIKELLLQTAIYCGVPDANTAFRIAARVLAEMDAEAEADG